MSLPVSYLECSIQSPTGRQVANTSPCDVSSGQSSRSWCSRWLSTTDFSLSLSNMSWVLTGVADSDPYSDPHVFGPPGSFYHLAKMRYEKNLDFYFFVTSLWLFIFEKWCKCTCKKWYAEKLWKKIYFLLASWRSLMIIAGSGSGSGSTPKCHNWWIRNTGYNWITELWVFSWRTHRFRRSSHFFW